MSSEDIRDTNVLISRSSDDANEEDMVETEFINVNSSNKEESDQKDYDPDFIEERFRVDRRKLEELIRADENGLHAEDFFSRVMKECDVYVAWPSKLKIGAKSKKDPYVKVSGKKDRVSDAKNKILMNLTTKSLRVTLKMNVSHTDHSHVIGKGGNNIKKVMMETACHIHFPDSNRNNNNAAEKSSQVSVAGLFPAVEVARKKIRDLLPLVISFDVPVLCPGQLNVELLSLVESVQQKYSVTVSIKPHTIQSYFMSIHVRTSVINTESAMRAADVVFEHLTGRSGVAYGVSLVMDLSAQHQAALSSGVHLNQIMQWTGTTIYIPDQFHPNHVTLTPSGSFHVLGKRKNAVYINGTMPNVFVARQHLLDFLPIVLMFDCDEEIVINPGEITSLSEEFEVQVVVKLKPKHPSKSVIIKTVERNVEKLYEARRRILNLNGDEENIDYEMLKHFSSMEYMPQSSTQQGVDGGMVVLPTNPTRVSDPSLVGPYPLHHHNPLVHPVVVLPGGQSQGQPYGHPYGSPHQPFFYSPSPPHVIRQINGRISVSPSSFCSYFNNSDVTTSYSAGPRKVTSTSPQLSPLKTASVSVKNHLFHHQDHRMNSEAEALKHHGDIFHQLNAPLSAKQNVDDGVSLSGSQRFMASNGIFDNQQSSGHFQSSPSNCQSPIQNNLVFPNPEFLKNLRNGDQLEGFDVSKSTRFKLTSHWGSLANNRSNNHLIGETGCFSGEGDLESSSSSSSSQDCSLNHSASSIGSNKAPGSNRPKKSINSSNNHSIHDEVAADLDYVKLKNLANQAMQKKPDGECRFPTDYWSGLGFSKSMPQSAIAEKLNKFNHLRYEGPNVPVPYELVNGDSEDSWTPGFNRLQQDQLNTSQTLIGLVNQLSGMSMAHCEAFNSSDSLKSTSSPPWLDDLDTLSDLDPLFNEIGLSKYVNIFKQQEIDMTTFLTLTDQDLKDLGVSTFGARKKMLLVIADLNRKQSILPPPPGIRHPFRDPSFLKRRDVISHSIRW